MQETVNYLMCADSSTNTISFVGGQEQRLCLVDGGQNHKQRNTHTDIATYRLNWSRGQFGEKGGYKNLAISR